MKNHEKSFILSHAKKFLSEFNINVRSLEEYPTDFLSLGEGDLLLRFGWRSVTIYKLVADVKALGIYQKLKIAKVSLKNVLTCLKLIKSLQG